MPLTCHSFRVAWSALGAGVIALSALNACAVHGSIGAADPSPVVPSHATTVVIVRTPVETSQAPVQATASTTPRPTAIVSSTPDVAVTEYWLDTTQVVEQLLTVTAPRVSETYTSPDDRWRVDIVVHDCTRIDTRSSADENALEQLTLSDMQTSQTWVVDDQLQLCGGVGAFGLGGLRWSSNSHFFYYTPAKNGVPDGYCWYWEPEVVQFDPRSRTRTFVGGGPTSPDGSRLAAWQGRELVIWDFDLGQVYRGGIAQENAYPGPKAWSPDSQKLVYLENSDNCLPFNESFLVEVDLKAGTQRELLRSSEPSFVSVAWPEPDRLTLSNSNGDQWLYVLSTGELSAEP